jgi:hypothetical protein
MDFNLITCLKALNKVNWPQLSEIFFAGNKINEFSINRAGTLKQI